MHKRQKQLLLTHDRHRRRQFEHPGTGTGLGVVSPRRCGELRQHLLAASLSNNTIFDEHRRRFDSDDCDHAPLDSAISCVALDDLTFLSLQTLFTYRIPRAYKFCPHQTSNVNTAPRPPFAAQRLPTTSTLNNPYSIAQLEQPFDPRPPSSSLCDVASTPRAQLNPIAFLRLSFIDSRLSKTQKLKSERTRNLFTSLHALINNELTFIQTHSL